MSSAPSARCVAWQVAHAESVACRGSVRGTVRGRAAHPARCHDRAAITHAHYPRALPGRRDGDIAPYHHYTRVGCTRPPKIFVLLYIPLKSSLCPFVLKHRVRALRTTTGRCGAMLGRHRPWGLPTLPARALPSLHPRGVRHHYTRALRRAPRLCPPWCSPSRGRQPMK